MPLGLMSPDSKVSVSLCIPTYNDASFIGDALRSALVQRLIGIEIIVVDNASDDGTENIVKSISAGDARVRYVRHEKNIGMARNFSACIALAKGDLVQILCADDVLEQDCTSALADALEKHPESVLAACGRVIADHALMPTRTLRARRKFKVVPGPALLRECFVHANRIGEPTAVMFRRTAAARGFNPDYAQAVDLEMWMHLLTQGTGVLLPEALCRIRQHAHQASHENIRSGRMIEDKRRLFRDYAPHLHERLSILEKLLWDARMAISIQRVLSVGGSPNLNPTEIFFPNFFRAAMLPLAGVIRLTGYLGGATQKN